MINSKRQNYFQGYADYVPEIAVSIWRLQDVRERTLEAIANLPDAALDRELSYHLNTIGTLLYHIAAVEADWFYAEVLEEQYPDDFRELFPHDMRDKNGRLSVVSGLSLEEHLARLKTVRKQLVAHFRAMDLDDYRRKRDFEHYDVTPEWVLHHLADHEAEHRGEILTICGIYASSQKSNP